MSEYIEFEDVSFSAPDRKTKTWKVTSKRTGETLAIIKWYGAWFQHCFFPEPGTVWNTGCLEAVNKFITEHGGEKVGHV